jgi:hypothetical protein
MDVFAGGAFWNQSVASFDRSASRAAPFAPAAALRRIQKSRMSPFSAPLSWYRVVTVAWTLHVEFGMVENKLWMTDEGHTEQ